MNYFLEEFMEDHKLPKDSFTKVEDKILYFAAPPIIREEFRKGRETVIPEAGKYQDCDDSICMSLFSKTIDGALSIASPTIGDEVFVYRIANYDFEHKYQPSFVICPYVDIAKVVCVFKPIDVLCIGKVNITGEESEVYEFGENNNETGIINRYTWEWKEVLNLQDQSAATRVVCCEDEIQNGYFTPDEILNMVEDIPDQIIIDQMSLKEWFEYYTLRCKGLIECDQEMERKWYKALKEMKASDRYLLGWNPLMEVTSENIVLSSNRLKSKLKRDVHLIDLQEDFNDDSIIFEDTKIVKNGIFDDCIYHNFDKWEKSKNNNVLFITGLSGSGKTTYAKEISKQYHATILSLDELFINSNNSIINKIKESDIYSEYIKSKNSKDKYTKLDKLFSYVLNILYEDPNTLYIVEGVQLFDETFDSNMILNKPIIVKLTPPIVSLIRGTQRDKKSLSKIAQDIGKYISNKKLLGKFITIIKDNDTIIKEETEIIQEIYKDDLGWPKCQYCDAIIDYENGDNGTGVCPQCGRIHKQTEENSKFKPEDFIKDNRYPVPNKKYVQYFLDNIGRIQYSDIYEEVLPILFIKAKEYGLTYKVTHPASVALRYKDQFPEVIIVPDYIINEETEIIQESVIKKYQSYILEDGTEIEFIDAKSLKARKYIDKYNLKNMTKPFNGIIAIDKQNDDGVGFVGVWYEWCCFGSKVTYIGNVIYPLTVFENYKNKGIEEKLLSLATDKLDGNLVQVDIEDKDEHTFYKNNGLIDIEKVTRNGETYYIMKSRNGNIEIINKTLNESQNNEIIVFNSIDESSNLESIIPKRYSSYKLKNGTEIEFIDAKSLKAQKYIDKYNPKTLTRPFNGIIAINKQNDDKVGFIGVWYDRCIFGSKDTYIGNQIYPFVVFEKYKNKGIEKQLLSLAINKLNGNLVQVDIDNKDERSIYKNNGLVDIEKVTRNGNAYYVMKAKGSNIEIVNKTLNESELSTKERNELPDNAFGLPKDRKYPLIDKEHVLQAIRWFNKCEPRKRKELARNIRDKVYEYDMVIHLTKANKLCNYVDWDEDDSDRFKVKGENSVLEDTLLEEYKPTRDMKPVYILLTTTGSPMSKAIRKVTGDDYTHASLSFDLKMDEIYSFNLEGFVKESLDMFKKKFGNIKMGVFCAMVPEEGIKLMKDKIKYFQDHVKDFSYNAIGLLGVILNTPIISNTKLFCSEFVDNMLKLGEVDATNKNSALVRPQEFAQTNVIFKLFDGRIDDYSKKKCEINVNKIRRSLPVNESLSPIDIDDKYLIIRDPRIKYEEEYQKSHKLLLSYDKTGNIEGMKFEVAKLWYLNNKIEETLNRKLSRNKRQSLLNTRARILNDFNTYLTVIISSDSSFSLTEYIKSTPFNTGEFKVQKSTLLNGVDVLKQLI